MNTIAFTRDVRRLETALKLWPLMRPLVRKGFVRRCRRCVLSEHHGPLNANGLCKACMEFTPLPTPPQDILTGPNPVDDLLRRTVGTAPGRYDAILLISGGKDSAFLLDRLRQDHPQLRLLTVLVNNGFMSPVALENVTQLLTRLPGEHIEIRPPTDLVRAVFRWALTHLHRQKIYSLVDLFDAQITFDAAFKLAADLAIPLVVAGLGKNQVENVFGPIDWVWPWEEIDFPSRVGAGREEALKDAEGRLWYRAERWPAERRPRLVTPFLLWDPREEFLLSEVERRGLLAPGNSNPLITNNTLIPLICLAEVARFGYTSFEAEFARQVREGKSARDRWLRVFESFEYCARTGRFLSGSTRETLAALGLSLQDLGLCRS